ncbi:hypothetical protein LEMLEM_LOCUS10054, partial [Lemmus lemmus]
MNISFKPRPVKNITVFVKPAIIVQRLFNLN